YLVNIRHITHDYFAPTTSTVRSEFFKPCQDSQEMAFCLNEGECFIIETVAGVLQDCRCKEGYRGLRCDQFVPKTDSILSDPSMYFCHCMFSSKENMRESF
uniref:EGF-like domain-containing protein n=1 Tax=Sinocyclocheilus grahami TaxID=75366 RepID=A0A672MBX1_SINGR